MIRTVARRAAAMLRADFHSHRDATAPTAVIAATVKISLRRSSRSSRSATAARSRRGRARRARRVACCMWFYFVVSFSHSDARTPTHTDTHTHTHAHRHTVGCTKVFDKMLAGVNVVLNARVLKVLPHLLVGVPSVPLSPSTTEYPSCVSTQSTQTAWVPPHRSPCA